MRIQIVMRKYMISKKVSQSEGRVKGFREEGAA